MYNPQLETFLRVADAGSFNKAAEESYITPTAVIKQINLLEESLVAHDAGAAADGAVVEGADASPGHQISDRSF